MRGWSAEDLPDLAIRPPVWTLEVDRSRRPWRRTSGGDAEVRDRLGVALAAAASAFTDGARTAFQQAAREWAGRLEEQAVRQMRESADWFARCLRTVPDDEDLAALEGLSTRLAAFESAVGDPDQTAEDDDPSAADLTQAASPDPAVEGCVVCQQMAQTLTSHLCTGQFRLATREAEQERHTLDGGFCPLHTWQYAAVASPVGISAGYAGLAASVADALESLSSEHDSLAADLAGKVTALTAGPGECPVCVALAVRERAAIGELVSQPPPVTAALCLRHLALTLSAGAGPEAGRALLRELAARLRRDSEEMRAFALKREAYLSGLVTAEESRDHTDALRRLAGLAALIQPLGRSRISRSVVIAARRMRPYGRGNRIYAHIEVRRRGSP